VFNYSNYGGFVTNWIAAGAVCVPQLQQELSQVLFQPVYARYEKDNLTSYFWRLASGIIEMLHSQVSRLCTKSEMRKSTDNLWGLSFSIIEILPEQVSCDYIRCSESVAN